MEERETDPNVNNNVNNNNENNSKSAMEGMSRKEKRKLVKKMKRKQVRRERAVKEREDEEARSNDPEEQMRLLRLEREEAERMERDRREFEERERRFRRELELKKKQQEEEEEERRRKVEEECRSGSVDNEKGNEMNEGDDWEYVEEGPAEIIWKGNEIIVKKKKVRVPKKAPDLQSEKQEGERPISNPLAPQSEAFEDYKSAKEVLESVAQQVPNFGTEQDKAHCPFHLKTGVCRFGARCSRVHFYPDKSCTLLMKNLYNGPGLAWEQDEGLECTDEEIERSFEDFYEDVHTEFLKFGEIVNFKVCRNGSSHLRGNVYVHYKLLDSAVLAYQSINGRYFAGKQISCEFINVTRWKVAICGEYMKSRLKTCSRGSACNFIHCFRNPGGDYEWADWDKQAPRFWVKKMSALFGSTSDRLIDEVSPRYRSRISRSRGSDSANHSDEDDDQRRGRLSRHRGDNKNRASSLDEETHVEKVSSRDSYRAKRSSSKRESDLDLTRQGSESRRHETYSGKNWCSRKEERDRYPEHRSRSSSRQKRDAEFVHDNRHCNDKDNDYAPRETPRAGIIHDRYRESSVSDRHHGKQDRPRGKHSSSRKYEEDSTDIDFPEDRLGSDKENRRKRSRHTSNASGGDRLEKDEKRLEKRRRRISRSKNVSDFSDTESNGERHDREDRHHEHGKRSSRNHANDPRLSRNRCSVDRVACAEKNKGDSCNFETDSRNRSSTADSSHNQSEDKVDDNHRHRKLTYRNTISCSVDHDFVEENLNRCCDGDNYHGSSCESGESERFHERNDAETNRGIKEVRASQKAEAGGRHDSFKDVNEQAETEREEAYSLAALKKLDEIRKRKDIQPIQNNEDTASMESSHDSTHNYADANRGKEEVMGSSKLEKNAATTKRRRI